VGLSVPLLVIGVASYYSNRTREMLHRERMIALEKGLPAPAEPAKVSKPQLSSRHYLFRGLMWFFVGAGLLAFCWTVALAFPGNEDDREVARLGLLGFVPVGVGLAYLVFYLIEYYNPPTPRV
jgi:hypothetical protein